MPWTFHLRTTYGSMTEAEPAADLAGHVSANSPSPCEADVARPEQDAGDEPPRDH